MKAKTTQFIHENAPDVPFIVYEAARMRSAMVFKRMWILVILLICLLFGSNLAWIIYESQFETVESWEIIQENADGYNNYIGNDGDIINGETDNQKD